MATARATTPARTEGARTVAGCPRGVRARPEAVGPEAVGLPAQVVVAPRTRAGSSPRAGPAVCFPAAAHPTGSAAARRTCRAPSFSNRRRRLSCQAGRQRLGPAGVGAGGIDLFPCGTVCEDSPVALMDPAAGPSLDSHLDYSIASPVPGSVPAPSLVRSSCGVDRRPRGERSRRSTRVTVDTGPPGSPKTEAPRPVPTSATRPTSGVGEAGSRKATRPARHDEG